MSLFEMSLRVLFACPLYGVPVLEGVCLVGVSALGVLGLRPASVLEESCCSVCTVDRSLLLSWEKELGVISGSSEPSAEAGTGSASVLCLTEFRLCARTRDQLVARKLSASNQNRTRWSAPRRSMKCRKWGIATLSLRTWSTVLDRRERVS